MKIIRGHNPGHLGCCRDDGNFQGEVIDESLGFNYIPGKAQPLSEPNAASDWRGKRRLTVDEYEYYYRMIYNESLPLTSRIAISFVLAADLKRLYPATPSLQKDSALENFVKMLPTLSDADKQKVYGEVYAFDYYLINSSVSDFLPANVVPYESAAYDFQKLIETKTAKQDVLDQINENKMMQDKRYQEFKMSQAVDSEEKAFDDEYTNRMAKFIMDNIDLFLKNMFSDEFNLLKWSEQQLKMKEDIYADVLRRVESGQLKPEDAVDEYRKLLNAMRVQVETQQNFQHPILKYVTTKK